MNQVVIGAFDDSSKIEPVTAALVEAGVLQESIFTRAIGSVTSDKHEGGAAVADATDIIAPLQRFGVSKQDAQDYAEVVRRGGTLIAAVVPADGVPETKQVMGSFHPIDLQDRVDHYRAAGYTGFDNTALALTPDQARAEREQYGIPMLVD